MRDPVARKGGFHSVKNPVFFVWLDKSGTGNTPDWHPFRSGRGLREWMNFERILIRYEGINRFRNVRFTDPCGHRG